MTIYVALYVTAMFDANDITSRVLEARQALRQGQIELEHSFLNDGIPSRTMRLKIAYDFTGQAPQRTLRFDIARPPPAQFLKQGDTKVPLRLKGNLSEDRIIIDGDNLIHYRPNQFEEDVSPLAALIG